MQVKEIRRLPFDELEVDRGGNGFDGKVFAPARRDNRQR
jgi:hypothetical protein